MARYGMVSLCFLIGCKAVDPAPEDFDALMHYFWNHADTGADARLIDAIQNLDIAVESGTLQEATDGSLTPLSPEEAAIAQHTRDPAQAAGIYLLNPFVCTVDSLTALILHLDQQSVYPGVYDTYTRSYTGSREDFLAYKTHRLGWALDYGATVLGTSYTATTQSTFRRISMEEQENPWPHGDILLWKVFLTDPADFGNSGKSLTQDYQIDLYFPYEDRIIHAYGIWREGNYGTGFTTDTEAVQRITLNNLEKWDRGTEELCLTGVPEPTL